MKTRIPIRNEYVEPRKASRLNIENLYATILHIIQLENPANAGMMTGFFGQIYNRALFVYGLDPKEFIRLLKAVRRWYVNELRGVRLDWDPNDIMNFNEDENCPELLTGITMVEQRLLAANDPQGFLLFQRLLFTLLSMDRVVITPAAAEFSSITNPSKYDVKGANNITLDQIDDALLRLGIPVQEFRHRYEQACKGFEYEMLSTKGPNGPQTWSAHIDAKAWTNFPKTFMQLRSFLDHSHLSIIYKDIIGCIKMDSKELTPVRSPQLGKLAVLEEWGGKTRVVAELDYWTQQALSPLHNTINSYLRVLPQDGTFDQHAIAQQVKAWTESSKMVLNSFDLSNATDRLPIHLQGQIIGQLTGVQDLGTNWANLLTMRPYLTPNGDSIFYEVGQPMGARSSFPMLALTHHVIVQIAAAQAKLEKFTEYVILGDDIVVSNEQVALNYKAIMANLDVPINEAKSVLHVPKALRAAEICKRVFVNGVEISMFNASEIVKTIKDGRLGPTLQNTLLNAGWAPSEKVFWTLMAAILDRDNLVTLLRLNLVPKELSGLTRVIHPASELVDLTKWFKGVNLTAQDLIELHTFVIATDQLKRLDSVLRAGSSLTDALGIMAASNANQKAVPKHVRDQWLTEALTPDELAKFTKLIDGMTDFNYSHPVLKAARAETNRISTLLHSLNSFDAEMVTSARNGLLEACRSAIGSVWTLGENPPVQDMRALFHRVITTLTDVVKTGRKSKESPKVYSINYSVTLTSIGRLWNVYFKLGSRTSVNALRASVARNIIEAGSFYDSALDRMPFESESATSMQESSRKDNTPTVSNISSLKESG